MSDAKDNPREQSSEGEPPGPLGGERLAEARRAQQISVVEVAKELHLDEPKVRALERNEFDILGAPVFAKGHLRKYAQLVKVDQDDVMADYYQLTRAAGMQPVITARPRPRREMSPGPWIAVIVVIIVVATVYWWFTSAPATVDEPQRELMPQDTVPTPDQESAGAGADDSAVLESAAEKPEAPAPAVMEPEGRLPEAEEPGVAVTDAVQVPDLNDGQMRMLVTYSGDCWTEITDARGRRLFFGLGTDGRTVELSGEAPFNVLFGNANNVSIRVNGSDRPISADERRGRLARLTIAGS
ncbi:MAG: helix-turn-helix domain-containing protein [Gammaproteobacteria bacterium]|nr:helix-turn-helix domain-containing protein [Gammaproteobacteria bacterium]